MYKNAHTKLYISVTSHKLNIFGQVVPRLNNNKVI